jgi:hypothetical protein
MKLLFVEEASITRSSNHHLIEILTNHPKYFCEEPKTKVKTYVNGPLLQLFY